jgi:peroxiredoxin Q/BCP
MFVGAGKDRDAAVLLDPHGHFRANKIEALGTHMAAQQTKPGDAHLGFRRARYDRAVGVAHDDVADAHGRAAILGAFDLRAADFHAAAVAEILFDGGSKPRRHDIELDGPAGQPPPQAEAGDRHNGGDRTGSNGRTAENVAIAGKKPANARKPTANMRMAGSVDGTVADRATKRDDGSPPRKPCALPFLVRHAPRASPRPWCLGTARFRADIQPRYEEPIALEPQRKQHQQVIHSAALIRIRFGALTLVALRRSNQPAIPFSARGGLPQFTHTRRRARMPLRKRRKEGIMPSELRPGAKAPAFTLPRDGGGTISLADFAGRKLVLYFYPRADTPGCTKEAIDFNRLKAAFGKAGTDILGVSADPVAAQDKFKAKYKLGISLASDEAHRMLEAYGVWQEKSMYGRKFMGVVRATFLIGPDQRIAQVWPKVSVAGHAEEVLAAAKAL